MQAQPSCRELARLHVNRADEWDVAGFQDIQEHSEFYRSLMRGNLGRWPSLNIPCPSGWKAMNVSRNVSGCVDPFL